MMTGKVLSVVFSIFSLSVTFVTCIHLIFFLSDFNEKANYEAGNSTSFGGDTISTATRSSIINIALLVLFVIQHSLFVTPIYKLMTYLNTLHLHRLLYNLLACATLQIHLIMLLKYTSITMFIHKNRSLANKDFDLLFGFSVVFNFWHPIPEYELWSVALDDNTTLKLIFQILHGLLWLSFYIMTISFDITEFLGIKSVYSYIFQSSSDYNMLQNKSEEMLNLLHKIKHPGFLCLTMILWIYPVMRLDRVIIAVTWPIYMALSCDVDENDLNYVIEQRQKKFFS